MDLIQAISNLIFKGKGLHELPNNPYGERYTFIMNPDDISARKVKENRIWYIGDANELLNYYRVQKIYGNNEEPIYNENRRQYFWAISTSETHIKRVHSGVPRAIITALTNVIGIPNITVNGKEIPQLLEAIDFQDLLMQRAIPLTMAEGWGAFKIIIDPNTKLFRHPIVKYYEANAVKFIVRNGKKIGCIFKDFYQLKDKNYMLVDVRRLDDEGNSCIEYKLYQLENGDNTEEVPLSTIPELATLTDLKIPQYRHMLAVPCVFMNDPDNPDYGRSFYDGKIDLFDDLDQSLSQRSQTCRVSTPVEYYPVDLLEKAQNGKAIMPSVYNRQFIAKPGIPNGDGSVDAKIDTSQPNLNFEQYNQEQLSLVNMIMFGLISPATMGINVSKTDSGSSQREKEKTTIMTRNAIMSANIPIIRELVQIVLDFDDYINKGILPNEDREISVKFNEFANPSFESLSKVLYPMWVSGAISTRMYVNKLYGSSLAEEDKEAEIKALDDLRKAEGSGEDVLSEAQALGMEREKNPTYESRDNYNNKPKAVNREDNEKR